MPAPRWLAHPLTRDLDLDDPRTTVERRRILRRKRFLRRVYEEWYAAIAEALPAGDGRVLELGTGAGFLSDVVPDLVCSEVLPVAHVAVVLDGQALPFRRGALRAVVMTNVFHHLPRPRLFLAEAARCVRPGGALVMIEPWVSRWSRWVYGKLHHEPFEPDAADWELPGGGPLSGANGALPWIVFERDRARFERELPQWRIASIASGMPLVYLLSGGVSYRGFLPGWSFAFWKGVEKAFTRVLGSTAMFARIVLVRTEEDR